MHLQSEIGLLHGAAAFAAAFGVYDNMFGAPENVCDTNSFSDYSSVSQHSCLDYQCKFTLLTILAVMLLETYISLMAQWSCHIHT